MRTKLHGILLCLGLSACTLGPDYTTPTSKTPDSFFRSSASETATPVAPAQPVDVTWWHRLHDPLLDTLVEQIAASNLDVKAATMRLEQSRAQRGVVASDLYPQVDGQASYNREKESDKGVVALFSGAGSGGASTSGIPSTTKSPPFNLYQYGFDATWELDLWGRVRRNVEAADAQMQASEEDRRDLMLSVVAELVRDYVELRGTQADIKTLQQDWNAAKEFARITQEKYTGGLGNAVDVANAKAQVETIAAQLTPLEQQQASLMNAIALLLAQPPGTLEAELSPPQALPIVRDPVPIGIPSELIARRPDIREADAKLHTATAEIGVAKAEFFPTVTLMGNGALQALNTSDLNTWAARTYQFGPSVTLPIFEGGKLTSNLKLTKAEQREAAIMYEKTLLSAFHDVDNALTAYRSAAKRHQQFLAAAKQTHEAFTLAGERYKKGLGDYLDVLTAERTLLETEQQVNDSAEAETVAMVQLSKALGGGWQTQFPVKDAHD